MYINGYFPFLLITRSQMPFIYMAYEFLHIYNTSQMLPFSIAYEITYSWIIINPLYAVYSLLLSLPLAHKHMYLTSYMFYTVSIWTCL